MDKTDEDELPYMAALPNGRERAFVRAMLDTEGNQTLSALEAGYGNGNRDSAQATGSRLMDRPRIRDAIAELCRHRLGSYGLITAKSALEEVAGDPTNKDRVKAAAKIWDWANPPQQKIEVTHTDKRGTEMIDRVKALCLEHGIPIENLLGPNRIDGGFEGHLRMFNERWGHEILAERWERLARLVASTPGFEQYASTILGPMTPDQQAQLDQMARDPRRVLELVAEPVSEAPRYVWDPETDPI